MTCNIVTTLFRGDDLVDLIKVNRPVNTADKTITRAELQVGNFTFVEENPVFPYYVSIMRDKSIQLEMFNEIHLRIYYLSENGEETYRTTCIGSLSFKTNPQVVNDVPTPQGNNNG